MRDRVRHTVERFVPAGAHLLDLGCGPGADAEHFARRGDRVVAIDWSPAMVEQAERRIRQSGLGDRVEVQHLGIHEIDRLAPAAFDAVYSNFGALNCVPDLAAALRGIAGRLRPGGFLIASVIGRICPWEVAFYLARGDWRRATVRFASDPVAVPLDGRTVWTRYYSPAFVRASGARRPGFHECTCARSVCSRRRRTCTRSPTVIRRSSTRSSTSTMSSARGRWCVDGAITF